MEWQGRALQTGRPTAAFAALVALDRIGDVTVQPDIARRVLELPLGELSAERRLEALRVLAVSMARHGVPGDGWPAECLARWEPLYPSDDGRVNQSLCELLVRLGSTNVVRRTLPLVAAAATQNERFNYLFLLRGVTTGWTTSDRRNYFDWLRRAGREIHGANTLPIALKFIRKEAEAGLTADERAAVSDLLAAGDAAQHGSGLRPATSMTPRKVIKDWAF